MKKYLKIIGLFAFASIVYNGTAMANSLYFGIDGVDWFSANDISITLANPIINGKMVHTTQVIRYEIGVGVLPGPNGTNPQGVRYGKKMGWI